MICKRLARFILYSVYISLLGCRKKTPEGVADVPPDTPTTRNYARDVSPRWSHDGRRIAFLRSTEDRRMQLFVANTDLTEISPLLEPELLSPDRDLGSERDRFTAPNALAWSPDNHSLAFPRIDWFTFEDGERLPGAGIWSLDIRNGRVVPIAVHPPKYRSQFYTYRSPQWSPDSRYISYIGEGINGQRVLFVRTIAAQSSQEVPPRFDEYEDTDGAVWEPQASPPALVYRRKIRRGWQSPTTDTLRRMIPGSVESADSGELTRITTPQLYRALTGNEPPRIDAKYPAAYTQMAPRIGSVAISPDGQRILFAVSPAPLDNTKWQIAVYDRSTNRVRFLTPKDTRGYFAPVWIDNRQFGALATNGGKFDVMLCRFSGETPVRLGTLESSDCDWSPDRSRVVSASRSDKGERKTSLKILSTGLLISTP